MGDELRYNGLPTIEEADKRAKEHPNALPALIEVINSHQVQDKFGIRLLHRHFTLEPNEIALYQKIADVRGHDILVLSPQSHDYQPRQPINFLHEGTLVAYEHTIEPSLANKPALADFPEFVQAYEQALVSQGVEKIYGLTILPKDEWKDTQELVVKGRRVTITVPNSIVDTPGGVPIIDATWKSGQELGANQPVAVSLDPGCHRGDDAHCTGCGGVCGPDCCSPCGCPAPSGRLMDEIVVEILQRLGLIVSGEH